MARALAEEDYRAPPTELPAPLGGLSYDAYRDIRFRTEEALWRYDGLPFQIQFFHRGSLFSAPMRINVVRGGEAQPVLYRPELFDFGSNAVDPTQLADLGFAGFRVHHPLNRPDYFDEIAVFLGASYFRAVGRGQRYGLSARGLALDIARPGGEQFPQFVEAWIEQPEPGAAQLQFHLLLDSPSITGAYRVTLRPGEATVMEVTARLFARNAVEALGIAPLTSMFHFAPNDRVGVDDFRGAVHDSEGLAIWSGSGERIWRPLVNPEELRLSIYADRDLRGFGLLQRSRDFTDYQDLEARYELRPSLWVEPFGSWGPGAVELVEIPTPDEAHDNIVSFWRPDRPIEKGGVFDFAYRLHWSLGEPFDSSLAKIVATRVGRGGVPGTPEEGEGRKFVIDFKGGRLAEIALDAPIGAVVNSSGGTLRFIVAQPNLAIGGWRVFFDLLPEGDGPIELRCFLALQDEILSEIWSYQWT